MNALVVAAVLLLGTDPVGPEVEDPVAGTAELARTLIAGDLEGLVARTPIPFSFDGRAAWSREDIRHEWLGTLERHPLAGLTAGAVEVLTLDEMVARHGKPPERLAAVNLKGAKIALVDLGGRPLLVFWKPRGERWVPFGVSD